MPPSDRFVRPTVTLLLAFSVFGCDEPDARHTTTVVGDTTFVFSPRPVHRDTAELRLVQRYGTFDGPVQETFTRVARIAVDAAGRVYAVDAGVGIKTFEPEGSFSGFLARSGEGPAEVGAVNAITTHGDSLVAVHDVTSGHIKVFHRGELRREYRVPPVTRRYGEDALTYDEAGRLWLGLVPGLGHDPTVPSDATIFLEVAEDGARRDSIFLPARYRAECPMLRDREHSQGFWADNREPWVPTTKWALGPDGRMAFGCPAAFRFDVIASDGAVRRIEIPYEPIAWLDGEREQFAADYGFDPSMVADRPAFARIVLAEDGRTWVWPGQLPDTIEVPEEFREIAGADRRYAIGERGAFEVFEADGSWLGAVRLPEEFHYSGYPTEPPAVMRGDTIWGVTVDDLDVEYVSRYVVEWPPG